MRAKFINEKFTEDGDPIRDLGIGSKFARIKPGDVITIKENVKIFTRGIFELKFNCKLIGAGFSKKISGIVKTVSTTYNKLCLKIAFFNELNYINSRSINNILTDDHYYFTNACATTEQWEKYFKVIDRKIIESLNEKFTDDGDPIHDMDIGITEKMKKEIQKLELYNVLTVMSTNWMRLVENKFKSSGNKIYYLGCSGKDNSAYINKIKSIIKDSKKISENKISTTGWRDEKCIFKLYDTKYGKIGTFDYEYNSDFRSKPTTQYIGTILAVINFNTKKYMGYKL